MNKQDLTNWVTKINNMSMSELNRFETKTLELSPINGRAKEFLIKAVNLRRGEIEVISPIVISDNCKGELS